MDEFCDEVLESIQGIIKSRLSKNKIGAEDFSNNQFRDLLNCMVLFNDESGNEESNSDQYHRPIRNCLIGVEHRYDRCVLQDLATTESKEPLGMNTEDYLC